MFKSPESKGQIRQIKSQVKQNLLLFLKTLILIQIIYYNVYNSNMQTIYKGHEKRRLLAKIYSIVRKVSGCRVWQSEDLASQHLMTPAVLMDREQVTLEEET